MAKNIYIQDVVLSDKHICFAESEGADSFHIIYIHCTVGLMIILCSHY
jgi:hypothetical protein